MEDHANKVESAIHVTGGWILLSRSLRESDVWSWDSEHVRLWIYLLLSVNAREGHSRMIAGVEVGYGQVLKSYRRIAEENEHIANNRMVRWSPSRVKRMLDRFRNAEMISALETDLGTLITIRNFRRYQGFRSYQAAGLGTRPGTPPEQVRNDNNASIQLDLGETSPTSDEVEQLWDVWLEHLGGPPPCPELTTGNRRTLLRLLLNEQLRSRSTEAGIEPTELFRRICLAVKASDHHMAKRAYQFPESLFRNQERRERWTLEALRGRPQQRDYSRAPRAEL